MQQILFPCEDVGFRCVIKSQRLVLMLSKKLVMAIMQFGCFWKTCNVYGVLMLLKAETCET